MIEFKRIPHKLSNKDVTTVIVQLDSNDLSLPELLEEFENFLRACGYKFDETVTLVDENG